MENFVQSLLRYNEAHRFLPKGQRIFVPRYTLIPCPECTGKTYIDKLLSGEYRVFCTNCYYASETVDKKTYMEKNII